MIEKELLLKFMHFSGFDWICDIAYTNGQELVASKRIDSDELWWRPLEVEGSGFTQLFKGSIKEIFQNKCPNHAECKDKNSTHYFMCHMTQEEFEQFIGVSRDIPPFKFNMIRKLKNTAYNDE